MASFTATAKFLVTFLLALATSSHATTRYRNQRLKETNMVFYMHDIETGTNVTAPIVAGVPGKKWGILEFGTVYVCADKLTEGYEHNSTEVGSAQGIYANAAVDGSDLHLLMSIVFTNKQYNGSTLEIQGADRFYQKYREVSVVSGTGMFRLASGYAILETVFLDLINSNAIVRWNVTVFHL